MVRPGKASFGPFQFDPGIGRLTKSGHRVRLQPKVASLLACLLSQAGEVISRGHLEKVLWPDGTYVDFDLGIKTAVKKLRDALGDGFDEPVYIQTVHGEGYRFIAQVTWIETRVESTGQSSISAPLAPVPSAHGRSVAWASALATVVVAASLVLLSGRGLSKLQFHTRDWVLIAAFENRTGEKVLDGSMEIALGRELSRSTYLNVAPPDRIGDALQLMRKNPGTELREDLARQVAIRDGGIKVVLAGRVEKFGPTYLLSVRAVEPVTAETIAVFERRTGQDQLLDAVQSIGAEVRRRLGEQSLAGVKPAGEPLEKATTSSLPALRAFNLGMKEVNAATWRQAAEVMEEATVEDPQFALAHIYAAHSYSNLNLEERAARHYQAAFRLASGVWNRERLFILGSYYQRFLHDNRRAMEAYEALVKLYPDDYWGVNNLLVVYRVLGTPEEAASLAERKLALRPNARAGNDLWELYRYYSFGQRDKAKASRYREIGFRKRNADLMSPVQMVHWDSFSDLEGAAGRWWNGDVTGAAQELARVSAHAAERGSGYAGTMANTNLVVGRIHEARGICEQIANLPDRSECLLRVDFAAEDRAGAILRLREIDKSGSTPEGGYGDAVIAAWFGQEAYARDWLKLPLVNGLLLAVHRGPRAAMEQLSHVTDASTGGSHWILLMHRMAMALALEQQGRLEEAIAELRDDSRPGIVDFLYAWPWPQCRLKLADLYREAGRPGEAAKVEDETRHYLSAGDSDHPVLQRLRH